VNVRTKHPFTIYLCYRRVTPAAIVVLPLSRIVYSAVTVSSEPPKRPKRQTSGDLRIGLHQYKLIRDDGMLRQEFPNTVYAFRTPPSNI